MGDKEDYLTAYRVFFENFAATVNPEDQLPVNIAGYTITEAELPGEVLYWSTQYLTEKQCPLTLITPLLRIILNEVRLAAKKQPNDFGYKAEESVFIALRLMQAMTARVNAVCLRYLDNSKLDSLPPPPPATLREYQTVSSAAKNSRRVMEDRHVEIGNLEALFGIETTEPTSFYAVYDGHAGSAAATYCAAHLHQYLVESPHFTTDLRRALRDAYLRTDSEFVRKSNQERACGGSTAVSVAVRGRKLYAAWAGDSLALLAKRMRLLQLVRPHKPGRQDERDRIEAAGGTVLYWGTWRVNGQLAVSRAIGDAQYKPYVTAKPEMMTVELDGDEDFVVVACDGLWDFVSEDDVALAVYRQLAADPDDLKAVTKRLTAQAKRQGSCDNISIIVVFLKEPRHIVADNCPPMDLGLDNALVNAAPPFTLDGETRKVAQEAGTGDAEAALADNGVDNSDSDSDDFGPETAVDADDIDADPRNHEPAPPTPPAHTVEDGHVDGAVVDNVAESGEESEDEWNYFKGQGDRKPEEQNPSEEPDEPPRSETPCQDNSAWESSSVDMNSSPLNPDAPVFIPGTVGGADVLLAESPRKPLPMDDIELPDAGQFQTGAVIRPAELLDLDNCDQLNGHHNLSMSEVGNENLNGNESCNMESLGFGFNVGIESDKGKEILHEFERIQKDTTDFCNIQVFQAHTETNPFSSEDNEELFERLKNKECDPMSMSFYQEKDDDTCDRFGKNESFVDLNAVQPIPDSDDEDIQTNGDVCENFNETDKENIAPEHFNLLGNDINFNEPNNDMVCERTDDTNIGSNFAQGDNFTDNMQSYTDIDFETCNHAPQEMVAQTDTPESHKLLFEQIPEIPDGKSSELDFSNEDIQDLSESEKEIRTFLPQDESLQKTGRTFDEALSSEVRPELIPIIKEELINSENMSESELAFRQEHVQNVEDEHKDDKSVYPVPINNNEILVENVEENLAVSPAKSVKNELIEHIEEIEEKLAVSLTSGEKPELLEHVEDQPPVSLAPSDQNEFIEGNSPEPMEHVQDIIADIHQNYKYEHGKQQSSINVVCNNINEQANGDMEQMDDIQSEENMVTQDTDDVQIDESILLSPSPQVPKESSLFSERPLSAEFPIPTHSPLPTDSYLGQLPVPTETLQTEALLVVQSPIPTKSPLPIESLITAESCLQSESPLPESVPVELAISAESQLLIESPESEIIEPTESGSIEPILNKLSLPAALPIPTSSPLPIDLPLLVASPVPANSPSPVDSALPADSPLPAASKISTVPPAPSPLPTTALLPPESPQPTISPMPTETLITEPEMLAQSPVHLEFHPLADSPLPAEVPLPRESPMPSEELLTATSPLPNDLLLVDSSHSAVIIDQPVSVHTYLSEEKTKTDELELKSRLTPEVLHEEIDRMTVESVSGPTPDIVPEQREETIPTRSELVTDIDIGIPESRAQEICMPVTNEIHQEDAVEPGTIMPPSPTVEPSEPALDIPPVNETPIAADIVFADSKTAVAAAGVAAAAAVAAVATATSKAKTPTTKKSPTTPTSKTLSKPAPKTSTTFRTPTAPATKTPTARTPTTASRTPAAKSPSSAAKTTVSATKTAALTSATKTTTSAPASARLSSSKAAPKTQSPRPTTARSSLTSVPKEAPVAAKSATTARAAPVPRPMPRPAAARSAATASTVSKPARPAVTATTKTREPTVKLERKSLTNGDVKAPLSKPSAPRPITKPAAPAGKPSAPATKPTLRPASTAARPAPRPAPRAPSATNQALAKTAVPKSTVAAPRPPLDKHSKDLANKRITAKTAPPRTAATKAPPSKNTSIKSVPKKSIDIPKTEQILTNGVTNGDELIKSPTSPVPADNALLPDVIA